MRELRRHAERLGLALAALLPRRILVLDVNLQRVLDLTDARIADEWGLAPETLVAEDWWACQEAGRAARRAGYEAIRFPSATGKGVNLAVFLDRLHPGSAVTMVEAEDLSPEETEPL